LSGMSSTTDLAYYRDMLNQLATKADRRSPAP
jgi:hypothetical protein